MLVKDLRAYINSYNPFDVPEIEFNNSMFRFIISVDGFLVLGPGEEAGELLNTLKIMEDNFELNTAIAMKVELC